MEDQSISRKNFSQKKKMRNRMTSFYVCLFLLFVPYLVLADSTEYTAIMKHSMHGPYLYGISADIPFWRYGGSAVATDNYIRLVPAIGSRTGYIYNTEPMNLEDFEVVFEFNIHNTISPGADGLGFWYVKEIEKVGSLYGQAEDFEGFGLIFDTYDNNGNGDGPSVIAVQGFGHKVKWDYDNDLLANQLARCRADFRNAVGGTVKAKITYSKGSLMVVLDTSGNGYWSPCLQIDHLNLPHGYYLGFTAATGGLHDFHDVYSCTTYDLNAPVPTHQEHHEQQRKHHGWYDPYQYSDDQVKQKQGYQEEEEETPAAVPPKKKPQTKKKAPSQRNTKKNTKKNVNKKQKKVVSNKKKPVPPKKEEPAKQPTKKKQQPYEGHTEEEEHQFFESLKEKLKQFGITDEDLANYKPGDEKAQQALRKKSVETNAVIMDALEEVTKVVRTASTKEDILNLLERVESIVQKQSEVQSALDLSRYEMKSEIDKIISGLRQEASVLHNDIIKFEQILQQLKSDIVSVKQDAGNNIKITHGLIEGTRSNSNFWVFFVLFQIAFVLVIVYWRRYQQAKSSKLF